MEGKRNKHRGFFTLKQFPSICDLHIDLKTRGFKRKTEQLRTNFSYEGAGVVAGSIIVKQWKQNTGISAISYLSPASQTDNVISKCEGW